MIRKENIQPIVKELREMIERSDLSQRGVEKKVGFSRGYLSQLLTQDLDLKVWHLLAVLDSVDSHPEEFFRRLYPESRGRAEGGAEAGSSKSGAATTGSATARFAEASRPLSQELDDVLRCLYGLGVESLGELRGRLDRCEKAVAELEASGLVRSGRGREG